MKELVVALLSVANTACFNLSVFQKTKRQIIHLHTYCSICDIVIYAVLGAKTGIANSVVNLGKNFAYSKMDSIRWTMGFSCLRIVLLVLGYEGPMSSDSDHWGGLAGVRNDTAVSDCDLVEAASVGRI